MKVEFCVLTGQALNTLGNTKWRVNKRILSIVDRIWVSGGRLADLVDRNDVSYFRSVTSFSVLVILNNVFY